MTTVLHTAYLILEAGNTAEGEPLPSKYTHHPLAAVIADPGPAYELGKAIDACRPAGAELGTLHVEGCKAQVGWADLSSKGVQHERQAVARTTQVPQSLSPTPGPPPPLHLLLPHAAVGEEDPRTWLSTLVRGAQPLDWRLTATFTVAQPGQLQAGHHAVPCELYPYRYLPKSAASPSPGVAGTISARGYVACDSEATTPRPPHTVTAAVEVLADGRVIVTVPLQGEGAKTWLTHLSAGAGGRKGDGNQVFFACLMRLPCPPTAAPTMLPLALISPPVLFADRANTGQKRTRGTTPGVYTGTGAPSVFSSSSAGVEREEDEDEAEGEDDDSLASMGAADMPVLGSGAAGTGAGGAGGTGRSYSGPPPVPAPLMPAGAGTDCIAGGRVRSPSLSSVILSGSPFAGGLGLGTGLGLPTCTGLPVALPLDADVLQPSHESFGAGSSDLCSSSGHAFDPVHVPDRILVKSGVSCTTTGSAVLHTAGPALSPSHDEDDDWFSLEVPK